MADTNGNESQNKDFSLNSRKDRSSNNCKETICNEMRNHGKRD